MKLIDTASMKEAERRADAAGLSYYQMMENAGQAAFSLLAGRFSLSGRRVCLLCGRGNNGGDALVMARLLAGAGAEVCLYFTDGAPRTAEAKQALQNLAGAVPPAPLEQVPQGERFDLLVDGVYGTGFRGELDPFHRALFAWARGAAPFVLALDIPSGVEADTGLVADGALRADLTAAFAAAKQAALLRPSREWMGECAVLDIGIEKGCLAALTRTVEAADEGYLRAQLSPLSPLSHKGTNGRLAAVCGSDLYRRYERTAHEVTLYAPQAAGLQCIVSLHTDGAYIGHQRIRRHIHAFTGTRDINLHHGIAFMNKIFFSKRILIRIRIRVDYKVLVAGSCIRTCPEEVLTLLGRCQFARHPYIAIELAFHLRCYIVAMLVLQY